jgi:hypothetical protein
MAKRIEISAPDGSAGEAASRRAPRRRGAAILAHGVTMWAMDPRSSRRTNSTAIPDFARMHPVAVAEAAPPPVIASPASLARARKFSCLQGIERSQNAEIFVLAPIPAKK